MDVSPDDRRTFLAERRAASVERFDTVHSLHYDTSYGAINPAQASFVARITVLARRGGEVLDAACGTGKHWATLLDAGLHVTGVDQSAGMLAQARQKHPRVFTQDVGLQDLARAADLRDRFDGLLCIDALECVPPEDWPEVTAALAGVLVPGAPAYVTAEIAELQPSPLPAATDPRLVPGEVVEGGGYYYCTRRDQVRDWLVAAGFEVDDWTAAESHWHLLLTRQ
ncbi:MAG: class I SAM-dependent DNA methyltransferase [Streptosporangiaceae bacterium]